MRNGMIIIDADGHALDQESMYRQRLPEQFRRRQSIGGGGDGFGRRQNGRIPYPAVTVERYLQADYPHWDGAFPEAVNALMERQDVSDQLKHKIFYENPQRLYDFTVNPADFKA